MSSKITNIRKAWNEQIESVLQALASIHSKYPLPSPQKHDLRIKVYEGDICAIELEDAIIRDITSRAVSQSEFTKDYIESIHGSYEQIQNTYRKLNSETNEALKCRWDIIINAMSATNILIQQNKKTLPDNPTANVCNLSDIKAKKSIENYQMTAGPNAHNLAHQFIWANAKNKLLDAHRMPMWENTIEIAKTDINIERAHTSEYKLLKDLISRMEKKSRLDKNSYDVDIKRINNAYELFLHNADARKEFLERQKCYHAALQWLYPDHKISNLYGTEKATGNKQQLTDFGRRALTDHAAQKITNQSSKVVLFPTTIENE